MRSAHGDEIIELAATASVLLASTTHIPLWHPYRWPLLIWEYDQQSSCHSAHSPFPGWVLEQPGSSGSLLSGKSTPLSHEYWVRDSLACLPIAMGHSSQRLIPNRQDLFQTEGFDNFIHWNLSWFPIKWSMGCSATLSLSMFECIQLAPHPSLLAVTSPYGFLGGDLLFIHQGHFCCCWSLWHHEDFCFVQLQTVAEWYLGGWLCKLVATPLPPVHTHTGGCCVQSAQGTAWSVDWGCLWLLKYGCFPHILLPSKHSTPS